jgi:simple sugar transport system permease protein
LGRSQPLGVVPAAILFGALRSGATRMQFLSQIPVDIISVIQALVLIFVAAPQLVGWMLPRRAARPLDVPALAGRDPV